MYNEFPIEFSPTPIASKKFSYIDSFPLEYLKELLYLLKSLDVLLIFVYLLNLADSTYSGLRFSCSFAN